MIDAVNLISFQTIFYREVRRFMRIWVQTILPSAITMMLYFVIFGHFIGGRVGNMQGIPYMQYLAPGLIMMAVITNSYANVVSSFFGARLQRHVEEILVSPTSSLTILLGYVLGGVLRGLVVGVIVTLIASFFTQLTIHHLAVTLSVVVLTALLFSLAGFTNSIFAQKIDDTSLLLTFVLTPLTYFGGVFYSIDLLPKFWHHLSFLNPILHMVNAFRFGILGVSDVNIYIAFTMITSMIVILFSLNLYLLNRGIGIRT